MQLRARPAASLIVSKTEESRYRSRGSVDRLSPWTCHDVGGWSMVGGQRLKHPGDRHGQAAALRIAGTGSGHLGRLCAGPVGTETRPIGQRERVVQKGVSGVCGRSWPARLRGGDVEVGDTGEVVGNQRQPDPRRVPGPAKAAQVPVGAGERARQRRPPRTAQSPLACKASLQPRAERVGPLLAAFSRRGRPALGSLRSAAALPPGSRRPRPRRTYPPP